MSCLSDRSDGSLCFVGLVCSFYDKHVCVVVCVCVCMCECVCVSVSMVCVCLSVCHIIIRPALCEFSLC
jgi:hypothetical protein